MKIFILIPWFHPAYKAGGPIQSVANMVSAMGNGLPIAIGMAIGNGQEAMEFKIFCSNRDLDGTILQGVAFDAWVPYNANTNVWYSSGGNILPVLQQEIKKEKLGHLFITGIYDWQYNFKPLLFCKGVKKIISVRGMLHPGALSQKGFKKKVYLRLWKVLCLHKKVVFHATDEEEKKYIQQVFGNSVNVKVAGNFSRVFNAQPVVKKEPGRLKLVSVALISPMKNILLVLEGLGSESGVGSEKSGVVSQELGVGREEELRVGALRQAQGDIAFIEYNIYGPVKDKPYWDECLACIKKLPANIVVNYHGDINPDKIEEVLAANHVFVLPSKSENYGHAIIEALYAGRPVITSNNTPWNELEAGKAGINISLTDKQQLIDAIKWFASMSTTELDTWSKGARTYAGNAVDLKQISKQYDELFG